MKNFCLLIGRIGEPLLCGFHLASREPKRRLKWPELGASLVSARMSEISYTKTSSSKSRYEHTVLFQQWRRKVPLPKVSVESEERDIFE